MPNDPSVTEAPKGGLHRLSDAWIFVSHSHLDLNAVRRVRDEFERLHANPLLFFLMSLKDDEELDSLIKREITARNIFLLCNSPSARKSQWVQKEREFVLSLRDRKIHELDMEWPWERQKRIIHETLQSATAFINYSIKDRDRVQPYIDLLADSDFAVFEPFTQAMPGDSLIDELDAAIERSVIGYFFTFLSSNWLRLTQYRYSCLACLHSSVASRFSTFQAGTSPRTSKNYLRPSNCADDTSSSPH
jgi:hypothetical protein